jgi:hypothetical protein
LVILDLGRFATCFVADSRLALETSISFAPRVTIGGLEWGWPLPPLGAGNSEMDAFPMRLR